MPLAKTSPKVQGFLSVVRQSFIHFTETRLCSSGPGICASDVSSQRAKGKVKGRMLAVPVSPERPSQISNQ